MSSHSLKTVIQPQCAAWPVRCGSLLLAGMVFILACLATSPQLHAWLHGSEDPQAWACCQGVPACGSDASGESPDNPHHCSFFVLETSLAEASQCLLLRRQMARHLPMLVCYAAPSFEAWTERAQARAPPIKS